MNLPPVTYIIFADFPRAGRAYAGDAVETLEDAADAVANVWQLFSDDAIDVQVLRIADNLNTGDVTVDVLDLIAHRMASRGMTA